jgi:phosphoenolpyruvate synthase/pyruvate phosphate dikinase
MVLPNDFIVDLKDIDLDDRHHVGERAANLGSAVGKFPVARGFVIAYPSYFEFLKHDNLRLKIKHLLGAINFDLPESIGYASSNIKKIIKSSKIPDKIVKAVMNNYEKLGNPEVIVQTTIISGHSTQDTATREYKKHIVRGESSLLDILRSSWASVFNPELIIMRHKNGIDHLKTGISALIVKHIRSAIQGRILTYDSHLNDRSKIVVQVAHDYFDHLIDRESLSVERRHKIHFDKPVVIVRNSSVVHRGIHNHEIIALAKMGDAIGKHFYFPQVIDWTKEKDTIYITNVSRLD